MPFLDLATSNPIKYLRSPRSLILKALFRRALTSSISFKEFPAKITSSTYTRRARKYPELFLTKRELSY